MVKIHQRPALRSKSKENKTKEETELTEKLQKGVK